MIHVMRRFVFGALFCGPRFAKDGPRDASLRKLRSIRRINAVLPRAAGGIHASAKSGIPLRLGRLMSALAAQPVAIAANTAFRR
jgi:hypothetical protein